MVEDNVFVLSKEAYLIDMVSTRFVTDGLININTPEYVVFTNFYLDILLNNKNVIEFDDDTVFITGYDYNLARSLFGKAVCNKEQTIKFLGYMLMTKYDINWLKNDEVTESIYIRPNFNKKEDIENWLNEKQQIMTDIKISNYVEIVG